MSRLQFQRLSPEREQRALENLQAWGERGSAAIRAIAVRKTAELLPSVGQVDVVFLTPEQFMGLFGVEPAPAEEAVVN